MAISKRSYTRTIILAVTAALAFGYSAIFHFDVPARQILEFVLLSLLMIGLCIGGAAVLGWVMSKFRR